MKGNKNRYYMSLMMILLVLLTLNLSCTIINGQNQLFSSSSYFSKILPSAVMNNKKTITEQRAKRIDEISSLATNYLEMEEMLTIEEKMGVSQSSIQARRNKMYSISTLLNTMTNEVQLIDRYCENRVGLNCETPTCYGKYADGTNIPCGGHGKCTDIDTCQCEDGYSGNECTDYGCYGVSYLSTSTCSGNGVCSSSNVCTCRKGFYGKTCNETTFSGSIVKTDNVRRLNTLSVTPRTCKEYFLNYYNGDIGDGIYIVKPKDTELQVYCDMKRGGWTMMNELVWMETPDSNRTCSGATQAPNDLTCYQKFQLRLTRVVSSSLLKDFKRYFTTVKTSFGARCNVGADYATTDPIMNYLCDINNRNGMNTYSYAGYSSSILYWLY